MKGRKIRRDEEIHKFRMHILEKFEARSKYKREGIRGNSYDMGNREKKFREGLRKDVIVIRQVDVDNDLRDGDMGMKAKGDGKEE